MTLPRLHEPLNKKCRGRAHLVLLVFGLVLSVARPSAGQVTASELPDKSSDRAASNNLEGVKGFTLYEFVGGSFYSSGHVTELETTAGYNFNQYFGVDVGIPAYFVGGRGFVKTPRGPHIGDISGNGFGDLYADLLVTVNRPVLTYLGTLRGTAPTGERSLGFSTGRATFDWDNYFDHDFGRFRPFADIALADTISSTHFFYRPFTTFGTVALLEGGATVRIIPKLRVGASLYEDAPIGTQKVFLFGKAGDREVVGPSSIDRDNGYSGWVTVMPASVISLEAGYDHSVHYRLNVFSFGIGINVAAAYRKAKRSL